MPDPNQSQEARDGGYGDDAGTQGAGPNPQQQGAADADTQGDSAGGRESPVTDGADADEALGNRTGGYGSAPSGHPSGG